MKSLWRHAAACAVVLSAACGRPAPTIVDTPLLTMNPTGLTPLAGLLTFATDQPVRATLTITDDENNELVATPNDAFTTAHELIVLGLRPDRVNTVTVALEERDGAVTPALSIDVTTRPLPDVVPPIDVNVSRPPRMEPGVTFLPVFDNDVDDVGFIVALDPRGDVVWYYDDMVDEPRRLANGNFLVQDEFLERRTLIELDMLGRVVRRWWATGVDKDVPDGAIPVAADAFHHDVLEMPSGNFLALTTEIRRIENYPTSETDLSAPREPRDVAGDRMIEFRPDTGEIVRDWSLYELIDTNRIANAFDATVFYMDTYDDVLDEAPPDWTHANGLYYQEATDSLLLSIRKLNAVIKIDLAADELDWILGNHTGWAPEFQDLLLEPVGDLEWPYGQHAPEITPSGTLLVYDNGSWGRAQPPEEPQPIEERYSRAVEYEVDEASMTVRQLWSYGSLDGDRFYSSFVSEADWLPETGNILLVNGGQEVDDAGRPFLPDYESDVRARTRLSVMEVTHTDPAEKLWEISIDTLDGGWGSYRAERLPSLYP